MKIIDIARITHEVISAYSRTVGDNSQPLWDEAPQWQIDSAVNGVKAHLDNQHLTPEESHQNWLDIKLKDGWKYGAIKCVEKKEHPCMLPYNELPFEYRVKNTLFKQIINSLEPYRDSE